MSRAHRITLTLTSFALLGAACIVHCTRTQVAMPLPSDRAPSASANAPLSPTPAETVLSTPHQADPSFPTLADGAAGSSLAAPNQVPSCRVFGALVQPDTPVSTYAPWAPHFAVYCKDVGGKTIKAATTTAGTYEANDLSPGYWLIAAEGIEYAPRTVEVMLEPGESRRLDILLEHLRMLGVVLMDSAGRTITDPNGCPNWEVIALEDGQAVASQPYSVIDELSFVASNWPQARGTIVNQLDGLFRLQLVPYMFLGASDAERFVGKAVLPANAGRFVTLFIGTMAWDCETVSTNDYVTFPFDPTSARAITGSVQFQLRSPDGGAVDHEPIRVSWGDGMITFPTTRGKLFRITGLLPGAKVIKISTKGVEPRAIETTLGIGGEADLGAIPYGNTKLIAGRAVTEDGRPVPKFRIACYRQDHGGRLWGIGGSEWQTSEDGRFGLEAAVGEVLMRVVEGYDSIGRYVGSTSCRLWVGDSPETIVQLEVHPMREVTFNCPESSAKGSQISVLDDNGCSIARRNLGAGTLQVSLPVGPLTYVLCGEEGIELKRGHIARDGAVLVQL